MGSPLKSKLMSMYFPNRLELSLRFVLALPKASNRQLDFSRMFFTLQQGWMDGKRNGVRLQHSHHGIFFHSHFSRRIQWQQWCSLMADLGRCGWHQQSHGKSAGSCQQRSSEQAKALWFKDQTPALKTAPEIRFLYTCEYWNQFSELFFKSFSKVHSG